MLSRVTDQPEELRNMETTQADITDLKNLRKLLDWEILLQFTIYFDFEFDLDVTSRVIFKQ